LPIHPPPLGNFHPASAIPKDNVEGCDDSQAAGGALDEEEEEEEEEILLIRKNSCHYKGSDEGSDIPSQALSALVSLQGLSISNFDQALEEVVLEDILSEPPEADILTIYSEVLDGGLLLHDSAGQEVTQVVSRTLSTLEGCLPCESNDPSHPAPMDVAKESPALEVAAVGGPAPRVVLVTTQPPRVLGRAPSLLLLWMSTLDRLWSSPWRPW
jgi:hypothetical protein